MESILPLLSTDFFVNDSIEPNKWNQYLNIVSHGKLFKSGGLKEVISFTNTCLNSSKKRLEGITVLRYILQQCETAIFTENAKTWLKLLLQALKSHDTSANTICTCAVLGELLAYISVFPELKREVANDHIQDVCQTLLQNKSKDVKCREACLECLTTTIRYFPGPCGNVKKAIESAVVPVLESPTQDSLLTVCSGLYAATSQVGGGGSAGKNHREQWTSRLDRVCATMNSVIKNIITEIGVGDDDAREESELQTTFTLSEQFDVFVYQQQINTMATVFKDLFSLDMSTSINVPLGSILQMVARCLSITQSALLSRATRDRCLLASVLPMMHQDMFTILDTLITCLGGHMIPYCHVINKLLVKGLSLYSARAKVYGAAQAYGTVKATVYKVLLKWLKVTGSSNDLELVADDLCDYVISDATPAADSLKIEGDSKKDPQSSGGGKGKKRRTVVYETVATHRKTDTAADHELVCIALQVLSEILVHHGCFLKPEHYKSVNELAIPLLLRINQSTKSVPIPYTSPKCRLALYHVMLTCVTSPHPSWPPPVSCIIRLLQQGVRDRDSEVSSFCRHAVQTCELIIHPRAVTLNSPIVISSNVTTIDNNGNLAKPNDLRTRQNGSFADDTMEADDVIKTNGVPNIKEVVRSVVRDGFMKKSTENTNSTSQNSSGESASTVSARTIDKQVEHSQTEMSYADKLDNKEMDNSENEYTKLFNVASRNESDSTKIVDNKVTEKTEKQADKLYNKSVEFEKPKKQKSVIETELVEAGNVTNGERSSAEEKVDSLNVDETERGSTKRKLEDDDVEESQSKVVKEAEPEAEDSDDVTDMLEAFVDEGPDSE